MDALKAAAWGQTVLHSSAQASRGREAGSGGQQPTSTPHTPLPPGGWGPYFSQPQGEGGSCLATKVPGKQRGEASLQHERGKSDKFCWHREKGPINTRNEMFGNLHRPRLTPQVEFGCKIPAKTGETVQPLPPPPRVWARRPGGLSSTSGVHGEGGALGEHGAGWEAQGAGGAARPSIAQLRDLGQGTPFPISQPPSPCLQSWRGCAWIK